MSAVSGERKINELNLIRAHDAAMAHVENNFSSGSLNTLIPTGGLVAMFIGAGALLAATLVLPGVNIVAAVLVGILGGLALLGGIGGEVVWWAFLYPMMNNCARTQYLYIDEMMQAGVRIFDLRINNKNWEDISAGKHEDDNNGHGYFQNWMAEAGDTYDWAPEYSLQDDLGFDYTGTDYQSNRDWLLAHSVLEEIDPATQIRKNGTRIVEPGEQITIMDDTKFTAQWGPEARSAIEIEWNDCDNADGSRPKELTVSYKMRGESTVQTATVSERTDWSAAITGLLSENAEDNYPVWNGVTGNDETGYVCTVSQKPGKTGYTIRLSHLPSTTVDISGTISWDDNNNSNNVRPDNVTMSLMLNGVEVTTKTLPYRIICNTASERSLNMSRRQTIPIAETSILLRKNRSGIITSFRTASISPTGLSCRRMTTYRSILLGGTALTPMMSVRNTSTCICMTEPRRSTRSRLPSTAQEQSLW